MSKEFYEIPIIDWDGVNVRVSPELPKVSWENNGWTYTMTDLRYVRESLVEIFAMLLKEAIDDGDVTSVEYAAPDDTTGEELHMISDVVCGFHYSAKRKRGSEYDGNFLCHSVMLKHNEEGYKTTIVFNLKLTDVMLVHKFAKENDCTTEINMQKLIEYVAQEDRKAWSKVAEIVTGRPGR